MVAYKRLKTVKNCQDKTWSLLLMRAGSFTIGSHYRGSIGKILVFWIGGRLERTSHLEVRL